MEGDLCLSSECKKCAQNFSLSLTIKKVSDLRVIISLSSLESQACKATKYINLKFKELSILSPKEWAMNCFVFGRAGEK